MSKNEKRIPQYSISVYMMILVVTILASLVIYYAFATYEITNPWADLIIPTLILIALQKWPIRYIFSDTNNIQLSFYFPILIIYGLMPLIIAETIFLLFFKKKLHNNFVKHFFNSVNIIFSAGAAYFFYHWLTGLYTFQEIDYLIPIVLSAVLYSTINTESVALIVYLENRKIYNKDMRINILLSNIMSGIITFYLYLPLGLVGVYISVLYAILLTKRTKYQVEYSKKKGELYESEQKARIVCNTIDYGVMMLDMEKKITVANRIALKFLKEFDPDPVGKKIDDFFTSLPVELLRILQWTYQQQENYHQKRVSLRVYKANQYFDIYTYPQKSQDRVIVGLILLFKDMTDEEVMRNQLIEADKLSRLGEIAAEKVHEIKNPLTTVRGYIQYIRQKVAKGEQVKLSSFDVAIQEIDRTNEIINSLLILSKHSDQEQKVIFIDELLNEVIKLFQHQFFIRSITLYQDIEKEIRVLGVENHFKQIFINLIMNAIDAVSSKKEEGMISITAYRTKCYVRIEIKDNGVGINQEDLEKLHMPFFTTKKSGSGLGLSVTYKLIDELQGDIQVESKIGEGTVFTVFFLLVKLEENNNKMVYQYVC